MMICRFPGWHGGSAGPNARIESPSFTFGETFLPLPSAPCPSLTWLLVIAAERFPFLLFTARIPASNLCWRGGSPS